MYPKEINFRIACFTGTQPSLNNCAVLRIFVSVTIVTTAAAAWDWIPGLSWSFVESNVDDVLKPFAPPRLSTSFNKIEEGWRSSTGP